ncbi:MAG: GNAT family N-acetyltransferase [Bacilli bacterium]
MNIMNVKFRTATYEDVPEIIKLCDICFDEKTNLDYAKKVFKETENDKNQLYLVGEYNGEIIAHTKITIIPTIYEDMNTFAILNHVCVKPEYRRHKIATFMLNEVKKICKEMNCKTIELWSKNFRQAAHACYIEHGFEIMDAKFFIEYI